MSEESKILKGTQYKKSTPQERFARQLDRDMSRPSGPRLSQSTIRTLITKDTASWAKSIFDQKASQNYAANFSTSQNAGSITSSQAATGSSSSDGSGGATTLSPNESSNASTSSEGGLDDGTAVGQMLYWSGEAWVTLNPPTSGDNKPHVLASIGGAPYWLATEECE